jgi:hypothetical protein
MKIILVVTILAISILADEIELNRPAQLNSETVLKGRGYVGLTFSAKHSKGDNFKQFNIIPIDNKNQLSFSINAQGGYFLKKYFTVGGGLSYGYSRIEAKLSDTLTTRAVESRYSIIPNIRNYLPWTDSLFFQIFNQTNLGFGYSVGIEESDYGNSIDRSEISSLIINLGIQPGLSVFVGKGVSVETSVSLLGFTFVNTKIKQNGIDYGYYRESDVNFQIDLLSINLGLTIYI